MEKFLLFILDLLKNRIAMIFAVLVTAFIFIWVMLFKTQVINYEHYTELIRENTYQTIETQGERGCIYDRYGRPLAMNTMTTRLLYTPATGNRDLNSALLSLIDLFKETGEEFSLQVIFPLGYSQEQGYYYKPAFAEGSVARANFLAEVYYTSRDELTQEQLSTSAKDAMTILCRDRFKIPDTLDRTTRIMLATLRYAIFSGRFEPGEPVRISSNVSDTTRARITERAELYEGFSFDSSYARVYPEGELFSHIIGYMGMISESELARMTELGYSYSEDDYIGKTGIEAVYEASLRGNAGVNRLEIDQQTGEIVDEVIMEPSTQGSSIFLTIDRDIQAMAYDALYQRIKSLLLEKYTGKHVKNNEEYSTQDIICALISNHFISDETLMYGSGEYLEKYRRSQEDLGDTAASQMVYEILYQQNPVSSYNTYQKDLYDLLIELMRDEEGHMGYQYQLDENFYPDYAAGKIAPYRFFSYLIDRGYIDLSVYDMEKDENGSLIQGENYISREEGIRQILLYETEQLKQTAAYENFMKTYVIRIEYFTEREFVLMLYEQGLITDENQEYEYLQRQWIYPIVVLKSRIEADEITPADLNLDPCSGSVVITDPMSGEVLAMVSYPSYDPERFVSDYDYYVRVVTNHSSPLTFRALTEMRAAGSTFKMCSSIAGLDMGYITPDTVVYDDYAFESANTVSKPVCWSPYSHGTINVEEAIDHSCNYFFYQLGYWMSDPDEEGKFEDYVGLEKLKQYSDRLGLSTPTGIEIYEQMPEASKLDAVRSCIGQGSGAYSCANINRYTCTLANGGTVYDLYLVDEIHKPDGAIVYKHEKKGTPTDLKPYLFDTVTRGMRMMVTDEHKWEFMDLENAGIFCAGKTGTAQEVEYRPNHSLFTGYNSYNDPQIVVTVIIPFGGGSANAIPVFTQIVGHYFLDR